MAQFVPHIGTTPLRREGPDKLTGAAIYTDDFTLPGLIHGTTVRSPVARGILKGITFKPGVPWEEFTVVTAADIPGRNRVALIELDQPFLVEDRIAHAGEAVALLAHPDKDMLARARDLVRLDIEPLPGVPDLDAALAAEVVIRGEDNVFKRFIIEQGDPDGAWAGAVRILEGTYDTGAQEHLYIEPQGMVGCYSDAEGLTVWGSLQCPYYVHKALMPLFDLPAERVRVVQLCTGGGFGGKEDFPSILAGHAGLLARKAGRPVKMIFDREEDMAVTTKRHPSRTRIKAGFDADAKLVALDIEHLTDGGAYLTLTTVVLSRGALHAGGAYACPNVRVQARAYATSNPPHGAFRGFGAPQSLFAIERHMDVCARALGLEPVDLRRRNLLRMGDRFATGQVFREKVDLRALMDRCLAELGPPRPSEGALKRGQGLAVFMHGCGFTGSGEAYLASVAGVEGRADGQVHVLAASTEMGQGATTMFCQVAAEALRVPLECVAVQQPDTKLVPDSGPTVASRTTMVVGKLVQDAAIALRQALIQSGCLKEPYDGAAFSQAVRVYRDTIGPLKAYSQYAPPPDIHWDEQAYRGDAYATYGWGAYGAAVAVDTHTGDVTVEDFVAVNEIGRVVHPVLAAGQVEGGVAQGIGWALWEDVLRRDGHMVNAQMTNYIVPTSSDLPRIRVIFEEQPYAGGPGGAKGLGELPMDGPAPAVLNAVHAALGDVALTRIPLTPERLLDALEAAHA